MAADPDFDDILNDLRAALVTVFQRGYRAGQAEMKESILRTITSPAGLKVIDPAGNIYEDISHTGENSAVIGGGHGGTPQFVVQYMRPTAAAAIRDILLANPGLTRQQILDRLPDGLFSRATIGNVLSQSNAFGRLRRQWFVKEGDRLIGSDRVSIADLPPDDDDSEDSIG